VSTMPSFEISVITEPAYARVCPRGEIDLATACQLDAQIDELWASGSTDVVADLREVTFMDSSGLHVLLAHHRRAAERAGRFSIIDGAGPVSRVLALTGMNAVLNYAPSEAVR
jgi:anti-sigma B factor antagonist